MNYQYKLQKAKNIQELFELVKEICYVHFGKDQAGLMVGLSDLGIYGGSFLGAYYSLNANTIVINKKPLSRIRQTNPDLYKPYVFHILLHEYIHSLGYMDETIVRKLVYEISVNYLGKNHLAVKIAADMNEFLPYISLSGNISEPGDLSIEYLSGIDRKNTNYII
ncbi:hypothetical protein GF327_02150 [Candidatus Woesearchaeota archaeon]|nr:hypothetical protein [Candidatus Woesearchaeota archaeon]